MTRVQAPVVQWECASGSFLDDPVGLGVVPCDNTKSVVLTSPPPG